MLLLLVLLTAHPLFSEAPGIWNPASSKLSGAGYTMQRITLRRPQQSTAGEPFDQLLSIRQGSASLTIAQRSSTIGPGDLIRIPRRTAYTIQPSAGTLEFIAIQINPLAPGRKAPAGIRPVPGQMGDVVKKAEIDSTIARTEANAPLHTQDNFTVNFVLFKGRTGPWEAHANCTDIYLVQTGSGSLQLGGTIVNAKQESEGEPRGAAVTGAKSHNVSAGNIAVIRPCQAGGPQPRTAASPKNSIGGHRFESVAQKRLPNPERTSISL
ncbi:MAG: hypothetical protein JST93_30785 [Acidobacteria bacterium]|nr:hypothetical protein [Acidobacteriota bacterium]